MPLREDELGGSQRRVFAMFLDTIKIFELIEENAEEIFGDAAADIRQAINEYLDDFFRKTEKSGEPHPEALIFDATREQFQRAGFYGAQLDLKEKQVTNANKSLRERLGLPFRGVSRRLFKKWVDVINNFLGSLASATGLSEALKELKDCLRDELPDD